MTEAYRALKLFGESGLERALPLDSGTYQDVVALGENLVLHERHQLRGLVVLDATGAVLRKVDLVGPGIDDASAAGLLTRAPDGVWVQTPGGQVRVLNARGEADAERLRMLGELSFDGVQVV